MGKRVLVADDSATIQKAFSMVLGGLQDTISLVPARSYDEALAAARQSRPDLVIADIGLGNRSGYDLCAAIKGDGALRGVPVYILGSGQTPYDEGRGRQAGADGHLIKPFESQALIDRIHEALSRPASTAVATPVAASRPESVSPRPGARPAVASVAAPDLDDEYGEFTIERSSGGMPMPSAAASPAPVPPPAPPPRPAAPAASPFASVGTGASGPSSGSGSGLRPSLIPGARPGAARAPISVASASVVPPAPAAPRPVGPPSLPKRTEVIADPAFPPKRPEPVIEAGGGIAAAAAHAGIGRTIMGLPAVAIPGMPSLAREARPAPSVAHTSVPTVAPTPAPPPTPLQPVRSQPVAPAPAPRPIPVTPAASPMPASPPAVASVAPAAVGSLDSAVAARIDQKVAAIAARGPEYEALAKLSREIIEQVVWEVVPELAEVIIREHVERLARK
jgi:CheY-like chemotaxis protein